MANKAAQMALINKVKKTRIHCELHVDRKKVLQRELDELYKRLGTSIFNGPTYATQVEEIRNDIAQKQKELETVEPSPNDATDIEELTGKLAEYVIDHFNGKTTGSVSEQVLPLMARTMAEALTKYMGEFHAMVLLSTDTARTVILYCMVVGFMFYNLLKTHGIKIITSEDPVSDFEIAEMEEISRKNAELIAKLLLGEDMPLKVATDATADKEESKN